MDAIVFVVEGRPTRLSVITSSVEEKWAEAKTEVAEIKEDGKSASALLFRNAALPAINVLYQAGDVHNLELNADEKTA